MWTELDISGNKSDVHNNITNSMDKQRKLYNMFFDAPYLLECIRNRHKKTS